MKRPFVKAILFAIAAIAAFYIVLLGLLQFSLFEEYHGVKSMETYLSEEAAYSYESGSIQLEIPAEVVSTEVERAVGLKKPEGNVEAGHWTYDPKKGRLESNSTIYGFYVPVSVGVIPIVDNGTIRMDLEDFKLGSHRWPSMGLWGSMAKAKILDRLFPIVYDLSTIDHEGLLNPVAVDQTETGVTVTFEVDKDGVAKLVNSLKSHVSEDLANGFLISENVNKQRAAEWMTKESLLTEDEVAILLADAFGSGAISRYMLLLLDGDSTVRMLTELPLLFKGLDKDTLNNMRYDLYGEAVESYSNLLIDLYEKYIEEGRVIINYGRPYSLETGGTLDFKTAAGMEGLEVSQDILDRMTVAFDPADGSVHAAYDLDGITVIVFSEDGREEMDKEQFEKSYPKMQPPIVSRSIDRASWDRFEKIFESYFAVDRVFIRYIATDGHQAFAIVSPEDDDQNYWVMALELPADGKSWMIIEDNVRSLASLNSDHPEFNMDLATDEFERITVFALQDSEKSLIMEQLEEKGYVDPKDGIGIDYCSFDGTYISFMLSDGREFVYKVEEMYLAILLLKEAAMDRWPDVPDMLLLDEPSEFM